MILPGAALSLWGLVETACAPQPFVHRRIQQDGLALFMRMRSLLTSLLAALLLSVPSLASVCEIRCDLTGVGRPCHGVPGNGVSESRQMAGMPGMESAAGTQADASTALLHSQSCFRHVCADQRLVLPEKLQNTFQQRSQAAAHSGAIILIAEQGVVVAWVADRPDAAHPRGSPHVGLSSPVSRHTTLRV